LSFFLRHYSIGKERKRENKASSSMEKQGCEIEALDIDYNIFVRKINVNPFGIFRRKPRPEADQPVKTEEESLKLEDETGNKVKHVLKGVTCRAKPWEILAIVGPSGAGKSSLLEILAARLIPQTGSVYVNKRPVDRANFKKISGYVTQKDTLFPLLTVEETLLFSAKLRLKLPADELRSRVKSLVHELGLEAVATKSLAQLGMKSELIIILATQKGSQISGRIVFLVEIGVACKGKWPHAAPGSYRRESHCVNQSRNLRKASPRWL